MSLWLYPHGAITSEVLAWIWTSFIDWEDENPQKHSPELQISSCSETLTRTSLILILVQMFVEEIFWSRNRVVHQNGCVLVCRFWFYIQINLWDGMRPENINVPLLPAHRPTTGLYRSLCILYRLVLSAGRFFKKNLLSPQWYDPRAVMANLFGTEC